METSPFKTKVISLLKQPSFVLGAYILLAIAASLGAYFSGTTDRGYTHYNNYIIFRQSFHHLVDYLDLYKHHEPEHFDNFKYSPAYAVLMAPFAFLPHLPGLILWNLLNALALFYALKPLPIKNETTKVFILWFVLQELLTTMQNSQCNGIMTALLIGGFNKFEKGNVLMAALFIMMSAYIKIYGMLAAILFLFYPNRIKFILYCIMWAVVFTFIPLLFVNLHHLFFLYQSWYYTIEFDRTLEYGVSLIGLLHSWFIIEPDRNILLLIGLILLLLPLTRFKKYGEAGFRLKFFASLMIWLIIFNQRAESSTYIVAIAGIALWYFNSSKTKLDTILVITAFVITSFSTTDLFPSYLYYHFVKPYTLKALPCILIWMKITVDLIIQKRELSTRPVISS